MDFLFPKGVSLKINDFPIRVLPQYFDLCETYEVEVFHHLCSRIRPGDSIVEIGGYIGLYTIPMAKLVGPVGKITVLEPEPKNLRALKSHLKMNGISNVKLIRVAAGDREGDINFAVDAFSSSHVEMRGKQKVKIMKLDSILIQEKVDILKIDTEGYEAHVLRGAVNLLQNVDRCPRAIYIEVHPMFWPRYGTDDHDILDMLWTSGYGVYFPDGQRVESVTKYGEIIAFKEKQGVSC